MCSSLDVAKIICKQLFMTQSVGCLFKHEMEAAIECYFSDFLWCNRTKTGGKKHQPLMFGAINGPVSDLRRRAQHDIQQIHSEMSCLPICEGFNGNIEPFGASAVCCRSQHIIFCALINGTEGGRGGVNTLLFHRHVSFSDWVTVKSRSWTSLEQIGSLWIEWEDLSSLAQTICF